MRDSIADRQEMIHRSPAKRQKREEIEEASEVCSTVASTIDSSRSVMPMPSSMTVSRPNLNYKSIDSNLNLDYKRKAGSIADQWYHGISTMELQVYRFSPIARLKQQWQQ